MGANESVPIPGGGSEGYHVLRVQENSPGQMAGLEPFFDFIVAIGNTRLDKDNDSLKEILKQNINKPLELTVYNSKTQTVRETQIVPSQNWGGQGVLGVSIRFCSFEGANQNVWHIISVSPNSPAELAGLHANSDYVLGAESVLQQADDLIAFVQANIGKPLKLYVYNVDSDSVREVILTPNGSWGGEGCLGCDIGYGYLHRIPISVDRSKPSGDMQPLLPSHQMEMPKQSSSSLPPPQTGIPQMDQLISASQFVASSSADVKRFPDPNEFALPQQSLNGVSVPTIPSSSVPLPPQPQKFVPPPLVPADYLSTPHQQISQSYDSELHGLPPHQPTPRQVDEPIGPPSLGQLRETPISAPTPSAMPFVQPQLHSSSLDSAPLSVPPVTHHQHHDQHQPQMQPLHQTPPPPIHTSTYQPYLAYGAPPLHAFQPPQQQQQYQAVNQTSASPFLFPAQNVQQHMQLGQQQFHAPNQPSSFYHPSYPPQPQQKMMSSTVPSSVSGFNIASPPSFGQPGGQQFQQQYGIGHSSPVQPQPPPNVPISFPMPPLSSLGISNLVVPPPHSVAGISMAPTALSSSSAVAHHQSQTAEGNEQQVPPPSFPPQSQPFFG
ncbi:hypothetical protein niasHT_007623 [Heterodera trifolii]|uniref:PDZ GRASP-type domain-containing protein n=1 Tax=Heterodera trifolii TaxID=157864 RepID=A0ABD2LRE7_9BILA